MFLEIVFRILPVYDEGFARIKLKQQWFLATRDDLELGTVFQPNFSTLLDYTNREKNLVIINFTTIPVPGSEIYGMRDEGINEVKYKIPVFGDSYTWGAAVNSSNIWLEVIESRNFDLDMINLGGANGISKAVKQYKKIGDKLPKHEFIIYEMSFVNEFLDNYAFAEATKSGFLETKNNLERQRWYYPIVTHSKVAYMFYDIYARVNFPVKAFFYKLSNKINPLVDYMPETYDYFDENVGSLDINPLENQVGLNYIIVNNTHPFFIQGLNETIRAMEELNHLTISQNKTLVIILLPFKEQVYHDLVEQKTKLTLDYRYPNNLILDNCVVLNISCFDSIDWMIQNKDKKLYWDYDVHLTPLGQKTFADFVESQVLKTINHTK